MTTRIVAVLALALAAAVQSGVAADPPPLRILFLGDNGHHQPPARFRQLQPVFAAKQIALTYTDKVSDLNAATLANYDGLMVYANHTDWAAANEAALLDFVAAGKGFIPVHCASFCFTRSQPYIDLVGAQFRSHGTGVFRTQTVAADHAIMTGYQSIGSWDETYTHTKHNAKDRTVLEVRTDGDAKEPWTWVRTHGKGRVFYTAWGHDHRTWSHPGFVNLLERGTRWACGQDPARAGAYIDRPAMTPFAADAKPFAFVPATLPFYPAGERWGTIREPIKRMQTPLPPAESVKHYSVPVGFEVKPFVTEEKLGGGKPICMAWDDRGRLWLAITFDYPNELQPPGGGRDKIVICEDADGDGVCDRVTTFADKLSIPTSILPAFGGLIVLGAPDTLFLKDTTGTGKADVRQVLFTGWGTNDTHAGPSNLRYGFDNWVYGMCGYSGFNGTVGGERVRFGQGLFRFQLASGERKLAVEANPNQQPAHAGRSPIATKLEFLRSTNNNSWGVGFDEAGELFGSTANGCPLVHLNIPNRYYEQVRGLAPGALPNVAMDNHVEPVVKDYRQVDWHGGFTAAAGCSIYTARTYPREYWNATAFVSEPTAHLTATFALARHGADAVARYGWNLLAGRDDWAAPIDAQVGPDGHVWVIDWYNIIVQHNPTPQGYRTGKGNAYEIPLRDKKYGRIYRVVYTGAKPEPRTTLKDATPAQLVETLSHPNMGWRLHAQRLLVERDDRDIIDALARKIDDRSVDATGLNAGAVHALHTLAGLKAAHRFPGVITGAMKHPSPAVRRAAAGLAGGGKAVVDAGLLADPDPRVRLAAILALADTATDPASGAALAAALAATDLDDKTFADAFTIAAGRHAPFFLKAVAAKPLPAKGLALVQGVARGYAAAATGAHLDAVLAALSTATPEAKRALLAGLAAWPAGKTATVLAGTEETVAKLLAAADPADRGRLVKLAAAWGVKGLDAQLAQIAEGLLAVVADAKASDDDRIAAAKQVVEFLPADDAAAAKLVAAVTATSSPEFATGIFDALAVGKAKAVGAAVVAKLKDIPAAARPAAMRVALARAESAAAFLDAVEKGTVRFDALNLEQKTALAAHPDKAVADRAKKLLAMGGGLPDANRQKVIADLHHVLKKTGDVGLGKKLYVQHCGKCHKHGGEGNTIGPDLTGFAVHPKEEILIHVLDPSRSVEGNFKSYTAKLLDGRVLTGLLASETRTAVELLDAENKRHAVSRDDIEELVASAKSLMPEGFEKQMTADELANLLEFMAQKGKYVPIPLDKYATAVSTKSMFVSPDAVAERLIFADWKPREFKGVPFYLVDPAGDRQKNVVLLHSTNGTVPTTMPKMVTLPCNTAAKAIHILGGIAGWASPYGDRGSVSMIVRLNYEDGTKEDHELKNGVHIADYIRRVDVPQSTFAFDLRGRQVRYLSVVPKRTAVVKTIDLVKGDDQTAPVVVAVTIETP